MRRSKNKNVVSFAISLLIHASVVLAAGVIAELNPLPEGTVSSDSLTFEIEPVPQGQQVSTVDVGKNVEETSVKPEKAKVDVKPAPQLEPEPVVVAKKKPAPKKKEKAEQKKQEPVKEEKPELITEEPSEKELVPLALPPKQETANVEDQLEQPEIEDNFQATDVADTADQDGLEQQEDELKDDDTDSNSLAAIAPDESVKEQPAAQPESDLSKKPVSPKAQQPALLTGQTQQNKDLKHQSDMNYGVATGVRDYRDLSQVPGNRPPQYPQKSRMLREQGKVELLYFVTAQGKVSGIRLKKSSGYSRLDSEALRAIMKYRYRPGQQGYTSHVINFNLRGNAKAAGGRLRTSSRPQTDVYSNN